MSKKISDFFKTLPKFSQDYERNEENSGTTAEVKNEKESSFEINLDEIETNSPKIRECRVILQDINKKKIKNEDKNSQIIKSEPESESNSSQSKVSKIHKSKQQIKCEYCSKKLFQPDILNHMRNLHSTEMKNSAISCEFCDQTYFTSTGLKVHLTKNHPEKLEPKLYECDFDGKTFKDKLRIQPHMKNHHTKVKCELCQSEILPHYMQRHIACVHSEERKFQCKICQKSFKFSNALNFHLKSHNKEHECKICFKMFSTQRFLIKHVEQIHENPNSFKCETCGHKFNFKNALKNHQKTHIKNRPKPFKCQRCDYATDSICHYKDHQKSHENQDRKEASFKNPIKCAKCPKSFRSKTALANHKKKFHQKVSYQCDLCGKYLKFKINLMRHIVKRICRKMKVENN